MSNNFDYYSALLCLCCTTILSAVLSLEALGQKVVPYRDTLTPSIDTALFTPPANPPIENRLKYSRNILNQSFDFRLKPISDGKFEINISGSPRTNLQIKVYDVIGNLLYEDDVRIRGFLRKELDLSDYKSNFFIIEIGNEDVNKTKSIVAI